MNPKALSLFVLAALLTAGPASAFTNQQFGEAADNLDQQLQKLSAQGAASCPEEHVKLNSVKDLKISLYYGYEDYEHETADALHAAAMVAVLQAPCLPNVEACGFKRTARTANMTRLTKRVGARKVTLSVYYTSLTNSNDQNGGVLAQKQDERGRALRAQFNADLVNNDVVFYAGHSRYGGGLGFDRPEMGRDVGNFLFRFPLRPMADALRKRPSRLKVLGLFACEADRHYRAVIEGANPYTNLILSHDDVGSDEGEQQQIGAINAILANKCNGDFQDSLVSTFQPNHRVMEYIRRPE